MVRALQCWLWDETAWKEGAWLEAGRPPQSVLLVQVGKGGSPESIW